MSEVVQFPKPPDAEARHVRLEKQRRAEEEQARANSQQREQRVAMLVRARAERAKRKKMVTESERRTVASNLWAILDRLETGPLGIRKAMVLVEAGKAQRQDSTKHLERYALKPGLPEAEEKKRTVRLVQAVKVYVDIARKAAELAGTDPDNAELEVLQGSRYLSDLPPERADDPDARAADTIAEALRRMTGRLAEKYDLKRYFERCERHRLAPENPEHSDAFVVLEAGSLDGIAAPQTIQGDQVRALDRCPGVYLGSVDAERELTTFAKAVVASVFDNILDDNGVPQGPHTLVLKIRCIATVDVYVRLAPFGPSQSVIPVLDLRRMTRVKAAKSGLYSEGARDPIEFDRHVTLGEHYGWPPLAKVTEERLVASGATPSAEGSRFFSRKVVPEERLDPSLLTYDSGEDEWLESLYYQEPPASFLDSASVPVLSAKLLAASFDAIMSELLKPLFLRHHEEPTRRLAPTDWADERRPDTIRGYFVPLGTTDPGAAPTVAREGTLLARLERWLRGDLRWNCPLPTSIPWNYPVPTSITGPSLEAKLALRIERAVAACDSALEVAERRLQQVLVDAGHISTTEPAQVSVGLLPSVVQHPAHAPARPDEASV